jgi:ArsR family transcriptional regulator
MTRRVEQFAALGQEDRLAIFRMLVRTGPQGSCVDDIRRRLRLPGSTLSHHLDALARSALVTARRSGRFIYYAVNWREASALIRFLVEDCCADMQMNPPRPAPDETVCCADQPRAAGAPASQRKKPKARSGGTKWKTNLRSASR